MVRKKPARKKELTKSQKRIRTILVFVFFILLSVFLIGMLYLATTPMETVTYALSFAAGLSMIVLPCTFPLVFVIVPLSMGKNYKKGFFMAILFSVGLVTTLTTYGVFVALAGQAFGLIQVTQGMYLLAGILAFIFGMSELKLIKFEMPAYRRMPGFIQRQPDYFKALLLGLFLGNAGIACPNPATYVILTYIAGTGSVVQGALLQAVNGIGRALPLIFLSILGIIGINATQSLVKRKEAINKATGWGLIIFGAVIVVWGIFGHGWFLESPIHEGWNYIVQIIAPSIAEFQMAVGHPIQWGPWSLLIALIAIPVAWYYYKTRKKTLSRTRRIISLGVIPVIIIITAANLLPVVFAPQATGMLREYNMTAYSWGFAPPVIEVNKGDMVRLHITSVDVTHGFAINEFDVNAMLPPGETATVEFVADKEGEYVFYCSVFCGDGHTGQNGKLIVRPEGYKIERPNTKITAYRTEEVVTVDGISNESFWEASDGIDISLYPTIPGGGGVDKINVKAAHNGNDIFILASWEDSTESRHWPGYVEDTHSLFEDRVALMFSIGEVKVEAPVMKMGTNGALVAGEADLWHWHAARDDPDGDSYGLWAKDPPYPYASDQYVNETSRYRDNKIGGNHWDIHAKGKWSDSTWWVEFSRPLSTGDRFDSQLSEGSTAKVTFAVFDGGGGETGEMKSYSPLWYELELG